MERSYLSTLLEIWDLDVESCPNLFQDPELSKAKGKGSNDSNTSFHTSHCESQVFTAPHSECRLLSEENCSNDSYLSSGSSQAFHLQEECEDSPKTQLHRRKRCHNCSSKNEPESNWCTNCGTALIGENASDIFKSTCTRLNSALEQNVGVDLPHTHLEVQSIGDSFDELENIPYTSNASSVLKIRRSTTPKLQSSPLHTPCRHWNTSSTYMWRKPSSLDERNSKRKHKSNPSKQNLCKNVAKSIPRLDLSMVSQNDSSQLSTRRKMSTKDPHNCYSSLELFPNEVLLFILSFLNEKDLISCMYVCSRLYLIASESYLWKKITLQKRHLEQRDLMSLSQQCTCLESLTIDKCSLKVESSKLDLNAFFQNLPLLKKLKCVMTDFGHGTGDKLLLTAAMNCPLLNSIDFDWIALSEEAICRSIQIVQRFESISIRQPGSISLKTLILLFSSHRQWLKSLNVKVYDCLDISEVLTATEYMPVPSIKTLASFTINQTEAIENIQQIFPSLESLSIIQDSVSTEMVAQLLTVSLSSLHLKVYTIDNVMTCCEQLSLMSSLRELSLNCLNDQGVAILCTGQLFLEVLDLSNSAITLLCLPSISGSSFRQVLKLLKLNNCQEVKRSGTTTITTITSSIISLIQHCSKLRRIEMLELVYPQTQLNNSLKKLNSYTCKIVL